MNISVRYAPVLQSEFNGQDASLAYSCLLKLRSRTAEERDHQPTEGCVEKGRKEFLSNSAIHNLPDASAPGLDFSTTEKGIGDSKELNLNRKTVQRVLRKYAEAIAAEDPDEALLEALAETPKDATSIANTLKNEYI